MRAIPGLLLRFFGIALFVFGIMWMLQGLGILNWPQESAMIADANWAVYGALTAAFGAVIVPLSHMFLRKGANRRAD